MAVAFADICFTDSVKAAQQRYGSRQANARFENSEDARDTLTSREIDFIAQRDSFYIGTVSETGWPYVQHRGGPIGFLKVLDRHTIAFADFSGNQQYLSVGNIAANDRVSLFLMDYRRRQRLKLWGRARVVHDGDAPDLMQQLKPVGYEATIERGIVIRIAAINWNCPQHISPR